MTPALLCETVTGRTMPELVAARDAATAGDMVELRLDGVAGVDVAGALRGRRRPAVVTCRAPWEGGAFDGSEAERRRILTEALDAGAEYVDVEWRAGFEDVVRRDPSRIVLSAHDFDGVPADLAARARAMRAVGAGTIKIAVRVSRLSEALPLLDIARGGAAVVVGMGEAGVASRLLATRFGSRWTYAGPGVAPGQLPAARMVDDYGYRRIGAATRLFGVVSTNALQSLSPAMHNAAFAAAGIDAAYVPLQTPAFDDFCTFASAIGVEGASVTIPFKQDALRAAARADDLARAVGAANTLRRLEATGAWEAANTDVAGFLAPLETACDIPLRGARVAVLGAGGSARAVIVALQSRGAIVTVHARRAEQAQAVAAELSVLAAAWPPDPGTWDLLVNTTPLGGAHLRGESPLPASALERGFVYDLTYGPGESALLRDARAAGCATLDGLPMLVAQAERQFEWWVGQRPAPGVMGAAAQHRLGRRGEPVPAGGDPAITKSR